MKLYYQARRISLMGALGALMFAFGWTPIHTPIPTPTPKTETAQAALYSLSKADAAEFTQTQAVNFCGERLMKTESRFIRCQFRPNSWVENHCSASKLGNISHIFWFIYRDCPLQYAMQYYNHNQRKWSTTLYVFGCLARVQKSGVPATISVYCIHPKERGDPIFLGEYKGWPGA